MQSITVPLPALAAANTVMDLKGYDPLGGDGKVRTSGSAHTRNASKASSASGGIASSN